MRILLLHAKEIWFRAVKEAIRNPPDPPSEARVEDCVVAFVSVERGDGTREARAAAEEVVAHARRVGVSNAVIYPFAHLSHDLAGPDEAHAVLVELESRVREALGGRVVRAPFGWYKEFKVHCAGHPMCELSRTIRGGGEVTLGGVSVGEAVSRDELASGLLESKPWDQEAVKLHARFQLHPPGPLGDVMVDGVFDELMWGDSFEWAQYARIQRPGWQAEAGIQAVREMVSSCVSALESGRERVVVEAPVGRLVARRGVDPSRVLSGLYEPLASRLVEVRLAPEALYVHLARQYSGSLLLYKARSGGLVPLAAEVDGLSCLGPDRLLAKAVIDSGLAVAEAGKTPLLPVHLAPIQVAVVPVKSEQVDYARSLAERLAWEGVRVYIDPPTRGLGTRVRAAARLWTPYIAVIGAREAETGTVSVRRREPGREQEVMPLEAFVEEVVARAKRGRRWRPLPPPPSQ